MKGVVMEVKSGQAIVLGNDGCFKQLKVRGNKLEVGQEIDLSEAMDYRPKISYKYIGLAAAILIMALFATLPFFINNASIGAVAYITIDINPSIELEVSRLGRVIKAKGLNEEGRILINQLDLARATIEEAIGIITSEAYNLGYLEDDNNEVFISSVVSDSNSYERITKGLISAVEKIESKPNNNIAISVLEGNVEIRNEAAKHNISTGKYISMENLKQKGVEVSIEEIKDKTISEIIRENLSKNGNSKKEEISAATVKEKDGKGNDKEEKNIEKDKEDKDNKDKHDNKKPDDIKESKESKENNKENNQKANQDKKDDEEPSKSPINKMIPSPINNKTGIIIEDKKSVGPIKDDKEKDNKEKDDKEKENKEKDDKRNDNSNNDKGNNKNPVNPPPQSKKNN